MSGDVLCLSLSGAGRRFEILQALQGARRCCDETGAAPAPDLSPRQQLQVSGALARASAQVARPLPARLARLLSPRSPDAPDRLALRSELEARLVTAAEAVHRLSPHPAALAVAVELLDVVAALDPADAAVDNPFASWGRRASRA